MLKDDGHFFSSWVKLRKWNRVKLKASKWVQMTSKGLVTIPRRYSSPEMTFLYPFCNLKFDLWSLQDFASSYRLLWSCLGSCGLLLFEAPAEKYGLCRLLGSTESFLKLLQAFFSTCRLLIKGSHLLLQIPAGACSLLQARAGSIQLLWVPKRSCGLQSNPAGFCRHLPVSASS